MPDDVVIVGGGPNGLLLACELALAGIRPIVLEQLPARSPLPKANGLVGRVVQALELRGLYEPLAGGIGPARPTPFFQFGGIPLDLRDLPDNPLHVLPVPQTRMEEVLENRALELGVEIRREHELTGLTQDPDGVTADVRAPGRDYRLRAGYLVGADGAHSRVRKLVGIDFPGTTDAAFASLTGHAIIPESLVDPETGELVIPGLGRLRPFTHNRLPGGVFTFAMLPPESGVHLVSVLEWGRPPVDAGIPMTFDELADGVSRVLGVKLPLSAPTAGKGPHSLRRLLGVNSRQASTYRASRVLLLGDAAHVHSAVGGPGLNLGLQDAMNLGWKLAAHVHGWAPADLLDTYEAERAPVSRRVLMHTRAQMALMGPGEGVTAMRDLVGELVEDPANRRRFAALLAGTDIEGQWLPDLRRDFSDCWNDVLASLRSARPVLVDRTADAVLINAAKPWNDRVDLIAAPSVVAGGHGLGLLIRPDGYIAWAAEQTGAAPEGLRNALGAWFGPASCAGG